MPRRHTLTGVIDSIVWEYIDGMMLFTDDRQGTVVSNPPDVDLKHTLTRSFVTMLVMVDKALT